MPVIATGIQTRWKDCFASSERVKLTLRTNGEEATFVIDPYGSMVQAGFDAPTVDPTLAVSVGGSLTASSWYAYRYVYASSNYPNVDNAVTVADGELWPRSNPSDYASAVTTGVNKTITITVTKTTRSDVDKILVYRTEAFSSQALAENAAAAGEMFYIANVDNNGIAGTVDITDNGLTDTGEQLETDNYTAPTAWFCVFDGTYWWAAGNPEFTATVTLNGTNTITITGPPYWFDGRDGQKVTFDDITSGGSDGRGTFYFKWISGTVGQLFDDVGLSVASTMPYSGTTVVHVQGFAATLYRSKPFNPFSWGYTQQIVNDDATTTNIPQTWALLMGGGSVTALAVAGNPRKLKVDFENPQKAIAYDLEVADDIDAFSRSAQDIDLTGSVTSHFSQFHGFLGENPVLFGLDTYNGNILAFTGTQHIVVSDSFGGFLLGLDRTNEAHRWFHGQYDPGTELNCIWVRYYDTNVRNNVLLWIHAPTQEIGWTPDFDVLSSCTLLDSETNERYLLGGTTGGNIGQLFDPDTNVNWTEDLRWKNNVPILDTVLSASRYLVTLTMPLDAAPLKLAQPVTSAVPASGTFVTTTTPEFVVGDSVMLFDNPVASAVLRTVTAISGNNVTVDITWTIPTPEYVMTTFTRLVNQWAVIQSPDGKDEWFVSFAEGEHDGELVSQIQIDEYIQRGTTEVVTPSATNAPWPDGSRIIFGCIPCYYLAYFNLGTPTSNKHAKEMWVTAGNVEVAEQTNPFAFADTLSGRYYPEFDAESDSSKTFLMTVNKRPGNTVNSYSFNRKNEVPSTSLPQFGIEIAEVGTGPFTMYDWTLKIGKDT
jgi:hypothetical protein